MALPLLIALALGGCAGGSDSGPQRASSPELLDTLPGYQVDARSTTALGLSDTASLLLGDPTQTAPALAQLGFQSAAVRIFTKGQVFVVDLAMHFDASAKASAAGNLELSTAENADNALTFDSGAAPDARAYLIDSGVRSSDRFVFCQGVVFTVSATAFEIRQCGPSPVDGQGRLADEVAHAQYTRVTGPQR